MINSFFGIKEFSNQTIQELNNKRLALITCDKQPKIIVIPKIFSLFFTTDLYKINQMIVQKDQKSCYNLETTNDFLKKEKIKLLNKMNTLVEKIIKLSPTVKDSYNIPIKSVPNTSAPKYKSIKEWGKAKMMDYFKIIKIIIEEKFKSIFICTSAQKINLCAKQFKEINTQLSEIDAILDSQLPKHFSNPLDQKIIKTLNDIKNELKKVIPHIVLTNKLYL
jgi:hypothetical protein